MSAGETCRKRLLLYVADSPGFSPAEVELHALQSWNSGYINLVVLSLAVEITKCCFSPLAIIHRGEQHSRLQNFCRHSFNRSMAYGRLAASGANGPVPHTKSSRVCLEIFLDRMLDFKLVLFIAILLYGGLLTFLFALPEENAGLLSREQAVVLITLYGMWVAFFLLCYAFLKHFSEL